MSCEVNNPPNAHDKAEGRAAIRHEHTDPPSTARHASPLLAGTCSPWFLTPPSLANRVNGEEEEKTVYERLGKVVAAFLQ